LRRLRYQVATSLDGYIAGPNGEFDWIAMDPDIDFAAAVRAVRRRRYGAEDVPSHASAGRERRDARSQRVVFSRTLRPADYPAVSVVNSDPAESVRSLKAKPGKDIWLFGGGRLFRTLLEAGLVDTVEPAVVPVLLGGGIPMLPSPALRTKLLLSGHRLYPKSGIMLLEYTVSR
jgi:dihydrofolate reductase